MDYYKILGVRRNASEKTIKLAYRKKAKHHHPDKGNNTNQFADIAEAYAILSDKEKRKEYDLTGVVTNEAEINSMAVNSIVATFIEMLQKVSDDINYVEELKAKVKVKIQEIPGTEQMIRKNLERIKGKRNKIKNKCGKDNIFEACIVQGIVEIEQLLLETEKSKKVLSRALVILDEYEQYMDKPKNVRHYNAVLYGAPFVHGGTASSTLW